MSTELWSYTNLEKVLKRNQRNRGRKDLEKFITIQGDLDCSYYSKKKEKKSVSILFLLRVLLATLCLTLLKLMKTGIGLA